LGGRKSNRFSSGSWLQNLERNFRVWEGEIDVIADKVGIVHFIEVKTRTSDRFGEPEESLVYRKKRRLLRAGFEYLEMNSIQEGCYQFDLIAIKCSRGRELIRLSHYEDVIGLDVLE
jgi:putative endonuclease